MKKLLRHLTNAPVAVALAFLLVGAPSAPMADWMPSSGEAIAADYGPCGYVSIGLPDADCDWMPDHLDPCPYDPSNTCDDRDGDGLPDNADPCPNDASNACATQVYVADEDGGGWCAFWIVVSAVGWKASLNGILAAAMGAHVPGLVYSAAGLILGTVGTVGVALTC